MSTQGKYLVHLTWSNLKAKIVFEIFHNGWFSFTYIQGGKVDIYQLHVAGISRSFCLLFGDHLPPPTADVIDGNPLVLVPRPSLAWSWQFYLREIDSSWLLSSANFSSRSCKSPASRLPWPPARVSRNLLHRNINFTSFSFTISFVPWIVNV